MHTDIAAIFTKSLPFFNLPMINNPYYHNNLKKKQKKNKP